MKRDAMKTCKMIAVAAVAMAMALVLTACGNSGATSAASSSDSNASASSADVASGSGSSAAAEGSGDEAAEGADAESDAKFEPGTIRDNTYENEFFGVQYVLPEGYGFHDEEALEQLNSTVKITTSDENVARVLKRGLAFYEMVAAAESGDNVVMVVEYAGTPATESIDEQGYLEIVQQGLGTQLGMAGVTITAAEIGTYKNPVSGDEFAAMRVELDMAGTPLYEEILCLKQGKYFMSVTATTSDEDNLDKLLSNLTTLKQQ